MLPKTLGASGRIFHDVEVSDVGSPSSDKVIPERKPSTAMPGYWNNNLDNRNDDNAHRHANELNNGNAVSECEDNKGGVEMANININIEAPETDVGNHHDHETDKLINEREPPNNHRHSSEEPTKRFSGYVGAFHVEA